MYPTHHLFSYLPISIFKRGNGKMLKIRLLPKKKKKEMLKIIKKKKAELNLLAVRNVLPAIEFVNLCLYSVSFI